MTSAAPAPAIIVAGLGRCGTSLAMQMLAASGVPCIGTAPDYEDPRTSHRPIPAELLAAWAGHAVKVLDPQISRLPPPPPMDAPATALVLWLERDLRQQALSQAKFTHLAGGFPRAGRRHVRAMQTGLVADRRRALVALAGRPIMALRFEQLIQLPMASADRMAAFLSARFPDLDVPAMAAVVRPRPTACAPDLAMELSLIAALGEPASG